MTRQEARGVLQTIYGNERKDFHALDNDAVDRVLAEADLHRYRKPKNANGSRARMFFQYVERVASRQD